MNYETRRETTWTRRNAAREKARAEAGEIIRELGFGRHAPGISGAARNIVITFEQARDLVRERSDG